MKQLNLRYYIDPGHGWIAIKRDMLKFLEIENKVSSYSYQNGDTAYLEEDCDASLLIGALESKNISYKVITIHKNKTPIRNYNRYQSITEEQ